MLKSKGGPKGLVVLLTVGPDVIGGIAVRNDA